MHSLLLTIASPFTPDSKILDLALVVDTGLKAFIAQPGTSASSSDIGSTKSNGSRNKSARANCATRDGNFYFVTRDGMGVPCHIIPHSVRGENADNFWAFVAMFKGTLSTELLKIVTLGHPPTSDNIQNLVWLSSHGAHACFDSGKLAIVPVVASGTYDPATVTEVGSPFIV